MKEGKALNRRRAARKRAEMALRKACRESIARAEISLLQHASKLLKADDPMAGWSTGWDDLSKTLDSVLADTFKDGSNMARKQVEDMGIRVGPDFSQEMRSRAHKYAKKHGADLVKHIDESVREDMRSVLQTALNDGWSTNEFAAEIESRYALSSQRAEVIARTEMAFADVEGNMAAYKKAGVELKRWITAGDDLVSDDCAMNAAAGPIPMSANFPSGAFQAPEHPNCRCDVIPVVGD